MTERMVAKNHEDVYSKREGSFMSENSEVRKKEAAPKKEAKQAKERKDVLSKNKQKDKQLKEGIDKWINRMRGGRDENQIKTQKGHQKQLKEYFKNTDIPQEERYAKLTEAMQKFAKDAKGYDLSELSLPFLVDRAIELYEIADEANGYEETLELILEEIRVRLEKSGEETNVYKMLALAHDVDEKIQEADDTDEDIIPSAKHKVDTKLKKWREKYGRGDSDGIPEDERQRLKQEAEEYQRTFFRDREPPAATESGRTFDPNDELAEIGNRNIKFKNLIQRIDFMIDTQGQDRTVIELASLLKEAEDSGITQEDLELFRQRSKDYMIAYKERKRVEPQIGYYGQWELNDSEKEDVEDDIDNLIWEERENPRDPPRVKREGGEIITADKISGDSLKGDKIDGYFNRIFRNVDKNPKGEFGKIFGTPGQYEWQNFTTTLEGIKNKARFQASQPPFNSLSDEKNPYFQKADLIDRLLTRYHIEFDLREIMHNAYYIADTGGDYEQFAKYCAQFTSEYADQVFLGYQEVAVAMRVQEQVLLEIKRENNGQVPPELVAYSPGKGESEFVKRTRKKMRWLNEQGLFSQKGKQTKVAEWRIDRAVSIARGYGMVTLRLPEIIAESFIPYPGRWWQSQKSVAWDTITATLNPWDNKFKRFNIGEKALLYFAEHKEKHWWKRHNRKTLQTLHNLDAITNVGNLLDGDIRLVDMRNLFLSGTPITHTGWRMYVPATDENGDLRQVLARNPGIQARTVFNRYDYRDIALARKKFQENWLKENPDGNKLRLAAEWAEEEKELTKKGVALPKNSEEWREQNIQAWKDAVRRIPHALFRIITDKDNNLLSTQERQHLIEELFGQHSEKETIELIKQADDDLVSAKEQLLKRRYEKYMDAKKKNDVNSNYFEADEDELKPEDFAVIGMVATNEFDENDRPKYIKVADISEEKRQARIRKAMEIRDKMASLLENKELQDKIGEKIEKNQFPFSVTWEDMPMNEFLYAKAGNRGFITRKVNDNLFDTQGVDEIINLCRQIELYNQPEQIVEQIRKVFDKAQVDDAGRARDVCLMLAKGVVRLFEREPITKIPIAGEIIDMYDSMITHQGTSYAQKLWGHSAMSWDADSIYHFWDQLGKVLQIGPHEVQKLQKETGGSFWQAMGARSKTAIYLLIAIIGYEMTQRLIGATGVFEGGGGGGGGGHH